MKKLNRYHFPVGGTVKSVYIIPHDDSVGGVVYWSDKLKRYVLESNSLSWQAYETRGCVIEFQHTAPAGGEGSYSHGFAHIYQGEQLGTIGR